MSNFKKVMAVLCSATMIFGSTVTAFATDPEPATIAAGTGNIIAYSVDTVTVPTAVKISFNPNKWKVYLDADDATGTSNQIVSLNYGVSSMATMDRKITVSFEAAATGSGTGSPVVFVDSAAKAAPKTDENPDGAEFGEYKLYLAVAGGAAKITAARDETAFAIADGVSNVAAGKLADVTMTAATGGAQAFVKGETKTETAIAFKLGKATYELKSDAHPTFETTQAQFAAMVQPKTLGDIVGFTFTGAMNEDADWTKANLKAIAITPTYELADADTTEVEITDGGYNQIYVGEVPATPVTVSYDSTNLRYEITLAAAVTNGLDDITALKVNGSDVAAANINTAKTIFRVSRDSVKAALGTDAWNAVTATGDLTFTFTIDGVKYSGTVARN